MQMLLCSQQSFLQVMKSGMVLAPKQYLTISLTFVGVGLLGSPQMLAAYKLSANIHGLFHQ